MTTVVSLSSYEYAAGPWALRLTGQVSSLSALAERVVLRRSRFQLGLWGEASSEAMAQEEEAVMQEVEEIRRRYPPQFEVSGHGPDLADLTQLVQSYVQNYLDGQGLTPPQGLSQGQMTLTPMGATRHRLRISAAGQSAEVTLSLLQLADLADVLAQAEQAIDHWPESLTSAPQRPRWRRLPLWTGSVAAVLVAAVLGSQWLGQMSPSVVQAPAPTTETTPQGDREVAQGANANSAAEGTDGTLDEAASPGPPSGENGLAGVAPESLPPATSTSPASPLTTPPTVSLPEAAPASAPPASAPPAVAVPRSSPSNAPAARTAAPSPSPTGSPPPATASGLSVPSSEAGAEVPLPAAASARTPSRDGGGTAESSPETVDPALADSVLIDWREALRATLQESWQPIPGLALPLRYRLSLGPTGEVLAVEPLTDLARQYLPQSRLPQVGEVLPNLQRPDAITVDVELLPSGEVRLDSDDLDPS